MFKYALLYFIVFVLFLLGNGLLFYLFPAVSHVFVRTIATLTLILVIIFTFISVSVFALAIFALSLINLFLFNSIFCIPLIAMTTTEYSHLLPNLNKFINLNFIPNLLPFNHIVCPVMILPLTISKIQLSLQAHS